MTSKINLADAPPTIDELDALFGGFVDDIEDFLAIANRPLNREVDSSEKELILLLLLFLRKNSITPEGEPVPQTGPIPAGSTLKPRIQGKVITLEREAKKILTDMEKNIAALSPSFLRVAGDRAKRQVQKGLAVLGFPTGFTPQDAPRSASAANLSGIARNIANIVRRELSRAVELIENAIPGSRSLSLGIEDDAVNFHFNRSFVDQSIDGHFRAMYRRTWFQNSDQFFRFHKMFRKTGDNSVRSSKFQGRIGTIEHWDKVGEAGSFPNPVQSFGLGHGSKAYFYPIPESSIVQDSLKVNKT